MFTFAMNNEYMYVSVQRAPRVSLKYTQLYRRGYKSSYNWDIPFTDGFVELKWFSSFSIGI